MSDIGTTASFPAGFSAGKAWDFFKKGELGPGHRLMAILVVLIVPLPTWLLDVSLAFSLSFSILI